MFIIFHHNPINNFMVNEENFNKKNKKKVK